MSSQATQNPTLDFKHAVALQFASRPTLRQVAGQKLLQLLLEHYPRLANVRPQLIDATPLRLLVPQPGPGHYQSSEPLLGVLLQAVLDGKALDLEEAYGRQHGLTFPEPYRFEGSDGHEYIALKGVTEAINDLVLELPYHFQQAQVEYWQAGSGSGVSRDRWLQQTLKSALLRNLPWQKLDAQQEACIRGLLEGGSHSPSVFTVEVELEVDGERFLQTLPNLLVSGEWDERTVVLWCSPSSVVRSFASLDDFALALRDELAEQYRFDSMSWNRYELEGDVYAQQAALLLEVMLDSVQRLRYSRMADVAQMEQVFAALSDPSQWFIAGYTVQSAASITLPPGILRASPGDSFAYQCALFELALAQANSQGAAALDGVLDLHSYASQRLRTQLLADHPVDANYFPDDLNLTLTVARGIPGGAGAGVGGGVVETRSMTLTEFAVGNLSALQGATLTAIEHREGQLIMPWMTLDYVKSLVEQVDIGGHYPNYVAQKLDDPDTREQRVTCFAREWRCSLLFSALKAKLGGTLSEAGLQCVADYCRGDVDRDLPATTLMPLAFKREPGASESDLVSGMYVLFSAQPALVLLYRPLYASSSIKEFASLEAMMVAIRQEGALQDSILDWLMPQVRSVYDHGGFSEPHLGRPILDTSLLPESVQPASLATQFWRIDVDAKLYKANRDLLVELADRQSVSNAESRWAILAEGAWLLFDVVTLLLRGPAATVAWLVQGIHGLKSDLSALTQGSAFERSAAVVDLLLNLGMVLFHSRLPQGEVSVIVRLPDVFGLEGPLAQKREFGEIELVPVLEKQGLPGSLGERLGMQLDFTWRGRHGVNVLPGEQRKTLLTMRSDVSLNGLQPLESGAARGLYSIGGHYYAALAADVYRVDVSEQGVRVVGVKGVLGPWLFWEHGQWRVDTGLRLLGGGPRRRVDLVREENQKEFDGFNTQQEAVLVERNRVAEGFNLSNAALGDRESHIEKLQAQRAKVPANMDGLTLTLAFDRKIALAKADALAAKYQVFEDLKELIKVDLKLDKVLSNMVQPKFARQELMPSVKLQRGAIRQELIDHCVVIYNDLAATINHLNVQTLINEMVAQPISDTELEHYDFVRSLVDKAVTLRFDLVWASERLDWLLTDTLKDDEIVFLDESEARQSKQVQLEGMIEQRRLTYNDLLMGLLEDLAELCLDRKAEIDEEILIQFHQKLWNEELKSAGSAHGELAALDLSVTDRISVLTGALKSYRAAQWNAAYLAETGGVAIKSDSLRQYQGVLDTLIGSAEDELAQMIRESELSEPVLPKPRLYQRRNGKHRVVQTHSGRSVIGEEVEVNGVNVVQQRDSSGAKVLKTFNRQDDHWVEQVEEPASEVQPLPSSRDVGAARSNARAALGQLESIIRLARQYIGKDEPIGMQSVIEGHVEKLNEASKALESTGVASDLDTQLKDAIARLEDTQQDLLTSYYLTTSHPTAASLRFLFNEKQISIRRTVRRKVLSPNDFLDIYEIQRLPSRSNDRGTGLWEAHFHYRDTMTPAHQFAKGHLKIWSQRTLGWKTQMEAAGSSSRELLAVYRGNLTLSDVIGVIPFE